MKAGAICVILFVLGVGVNLTFGRRGFLPLDQSIVFDGGWRMLSGQMPFRDFTAPSGLVPSAMQALLFRLFGVSWFAYCLHASLLNGVFAVAIFWLLRLCASTPIEAAVFAALSAFFFYPPTGTPFMDQHSFFFMTLMFLAAAAGTAARGSAELACWFVIPTLFTLGYLSGQIPMSFGAVAVALFVAAHPRRAPRWVAALTAGTACLAVALIAIGWAAGVDWSEAIRTTVVSPWHVAGDRTARSGVLGPVRMIASSLVRNPLRVDLWSLSAALAAAIPLAIVNRSLRRASVQTWVFLSCTLTTAAFLAYTRTLMQTGVGLAMVIVAIVITSVRQTLPPRLAWAGIGVLGLLVARDAVTFVRQVDAARLPHVAYDPGAAARAKGHLPPALAFMGWSRGASSYEPEQMTSLVQFLHDADGDFFLIGDSSILYGLAGKPSASPVLWFDPGLTVPRLDSAEFAGFEDRLVERMRRFGVRRIVLERPVTWTLLTFDHFPRLVAWTRSGACGERRFGAVRVLELCPES